MVESRVPYDLLREYNAVLREKKRLKNTSLPRRLADYRAFVLRQAANLQLFPVIQQAFVDANDSFVREDARQLLEKNVTQPFAWLQEVSRSFATATGPIWQTSFPGLVEMLVTPDEKCVLSLVHDVHNSSTWSVVVLDATTGEELHQESLSLQMPTENHTPRMRLHDQRLLIAGYSTIELFELTSNQTLNHQTTLGNIGTILDATLTNNAVYVLQCEHCGTSAPRLLSFHLPLMESGRTLSLKAPVSSATISANGKWIATIVPRKISLFNLPECGSPKYLISSRWDASGYQQPCFSDDGNYFAVIQSNFLGQEGSIYYLRAYKLSGPTLVSCRGPLFSKQSFGIDQDTTLLSVSKTGKYIAHASQRDLSDSMRCLSVFLINNAEVRSIEVTSEWHHGDRIASYVQSVALLEDSKRIVAGDVHGRLQAFSLLEEDVEIIKEERARGRFHCCSIASGNAGERLILTVSDRVSYSRTLGNTRELRVWRWTSDSMVALRSCNVPYDVAGLSCGSRPGVAVAFGSETIAYVDYDNDGNVALSENLASVACDYFAFERISSVVCTNRPDECVVSAVIVDVDEEMCEACGLAVDFPDWSILDEYGWRSVVLEIKSRTEVHLAFAPNADTLFVWNSAVGFHGFSVPQEGSPLYLHPFDISWGSQEGELLSEVSCMSCSADGQCVVMGTSKGEVVCLTRHEERWLASRSSTGFPRRVEKVVISNDSRFVACSREDVVSLFLRDVQGRLDQACEFRCQGQVLDFDFVVDEDVKIIVVSRGQIQLLKYHAGQ